MIIGIDMGHSLSGAGTGAAGILSEVAENRKIGNRLIQMLREKGHTVIDCTVDYANSTNEQLAAIIRKANAQTLDLLASIHLNSGGGIGTEIYVYATGGRAEGYANNILKETVASCNFRNRGFKTANFAVLRETTAPAVLLEVCFVDSQEDASKLNIEAVARGMFKGITGTDYSGTTPVTPPTPQPSAGVPGANAVVVGDWLYVRDSNGNVIEGRRVDIGDKIKVIDISGSRQIAYIKYPTPSGVRDGYVKVTSCIKYFNDHSYYVSGSRNVFDVQTVSQTLGSVANEKVTVLEDFGSRMNVAYDTSKGKNTKSGVIYK